MKVFNIKAHYNPNTKAEDYYVVAKSKSDARKKFKNIITWLKIYEVVETDMKISDLDREGMIVI